MDISLEVEELYNLLDDIYGISIRVAIKKLPTIREHFLPYKDILSESEELKNNTDLIQDKLQEYSNLVKKLFKPQNIFVAKIIGLELEESLDALLGEPF